LPVIIGIISDARKRKEHGHLRIVFDAKDRGDVSGVRLHGQRVVLECKDTTAMRLPEWITEAQLEAGTTTPALTGVPFASCVRTHRPWYTSHGVALTALLAR
jgi:hypothetical protein